jgi:rhamnulose-1-phosphate aldolase
MRIFSKHTKFKSLLCEIQQTSKLLCSKGWAEANAGNFSINITDLCKGIELNLNKINGIKTSKTYKSLSNQFLLITLSGSKMREITENPLNGLCLLCFNKSGNLYYNIPLCKAINNKPTSELYTHLGIQNLLSKKNAEEKVVLHTHPAELIALTHLKKFKKEKELNKIFFSIQPEVSILFPEGIGFVPYFKTGSKKLAEQTKKKFNNHKIILWKKHGCVSIGTNLNDAFEGIEMLVRSAKIFFTSSASDNKQDDISVSKIIG